jgi:hypothetical protein
MTEAETQAAPFADIAGQPGSAPRHHVLTLGNRSTYEIGRRLAIGWRHEHIWHATWPSLGGDPLPLTRNLGDPMFDRIRADARAECNKTIVERIKSAHWDIAVLSTGTHVGTSYAVDGKRCVPDFTQLPWLTDIDLGGARRPRISDFTGGTIHRVDWLDPGFAALAKAGFDRLYERIFKPGVAAGRKVFVHRQMPARWVMTPKGVERLDVPGLGEMEALSRDLAEHASRFKGVSVIDDLDALNFTSDDATEGRGPLNPIDEQFVYLASRIAHALNDPMEERLFAHHLLETRRERIALEWQAVGDTRQREHDLEAIVRALIDRSAGLERDILALKRTLSWRITKPLRTVRSVMRRRGPGQNA